MYEAVSFVNELDKFNLIGTVDSTGDKRDSKSATEEDLRAAMLENGQYTDIEKMFSVAPGLVQFRALKDGVPCLVKLTGAGDDESLLRLRSEWDVLETLRLAAIDGVSYPSSWSHLTNAVSIVFAEELANCRTLKELYLSRERVDDLDWLLLLKRIYSVCQTLSQCHLQDLRHGNIRPEVIMCKTSEADIHEVTYLCSWLYASKLVVESSYHSASVLNVSLPYVAPECTGRMNRNVDLRADLYSLGVTLYQIICLRLPFTGASKLEIMHKHISEAVVPPSNFLNVPPPVEMVILKLLKKMPEDRYQSADGLLFDLERIIHSLQDPAGNPLSDIQIGREDHASRFVVASEFVGRDQEILSLVSQFEAVRQDSQSRVVTIGGYSGVGKSRLVREFLSSVSESKVFYTECKFDQYKTFAPFATMKILLRDLLAQIFVEPPDILESWRLKIASALGQDAQAVCDICPDLVTLLTTDYLRSLPPTVPLGAIASEERIRRGMRALIQGFATKQHQLVIFVDDLQWSPAADLQIIMNIRERPNMLIICAYRDNEIGPDHMVKTMFIDNVRPNLCLSLEALSPYCTAQLVCATLHRPVPSGPELSESDRCLQELVDLIQVRSQGNCFFIPQILQSLYRSKLLTYDYKKKTWTWDMGSVQALEISDDVVCLVIRQVTTLSGSCQDILKVASCLGNSGFRLEFLEKATSRSRSEIAKELFGAMSIGLVVAVDDNYKSALALENSDMWSTPRPASEEDRLGQSKILESSLPSLAPGKELGGDLAVSYRFLHDRVQQAVYALVDDTDKPALHLAIGMALLDAYGEVLTDTMLFDICSQVNKGAHLVQGTEQRLSMAWLNLRAARIAFGNTANGFAFELLQHVSEYLIGDLWQYGTKLAETFYDLMEEVCASLTQYDKALAAASEILERTQNSVTRIRMYNKKMKILVSQGSVPEALSTAAAGLLEAGIDFGQYVAGNIDEKQISEIADRLWEEIPLGLSSVDDLRSMPFIEDDHLIAATDLLMSMFSPLFLYRPSLAAVLALSGVKLSMSKGLGAYSCFFMSFLSMMLCEADNPRCDFISARAYCEAAEELLGELMKGNQRYTEKAPATLTLVGCTYSFTRDPRIDGKRAFDWAIELSQRCFDGEYIAYALGSNAITRLFSGENLRTLVPESRRHIAAVESYKRPVGSFYVLPVLQTITNFVQHKNFRDMCSLSGTLLRDEAEALSFIQDGNLLLHQVFYWASKLVCAVLCNDQDAALKAVNEGAKVINGVSGVPAKVYFETFSLLVLADNLHCQRPLSNDLTNYLDVILAHIDVWSKQNPSQFGAWQYISTAEIRKHSGSLSWVLEQYNLAIDIVTTAKNYLLMGLFNERCARYLLAKGHGVRVAYGFLSEAMRSYLTWGCHAKVNMIATEFGLEDSSTPQLYQEDAKTDSAYSDYSDNLLAACHLKASSKAGSRMQTKTNSTPSLQGPHDILMTKIPNSSVSEVSLSHHHNGIELQTGSASNSAEMDLATVIENSLLLSKALHTTDVIGQLLKHLLQVAGAQAGALISDVHQDQHFMLVATAHVDQVQLYKDMSLEAADHLIPVELIRLAANSKRCIIDERKYMRKRLEVTTQQISEPTPKSFMALPVILSGKVMAVAYLSNDQVSNLFTERKVELLTILAAQAAIALEKGRIYTELKRANAELSENKKSLEHQTERLEAIVRERTGQLQKQNDVLTSEITQRTSIEAELVQAKDTAEQATAMKSRFLAMMSHEMRTPFNAVIGFSTLLLDTHLTSEQKDMTQSIVDASTDLIAIINDILDFSKIENDKMNLDPIWFDLRPMTESTLEVVARDAGSKDIILGYFEEETKSGTWIYADNTRLRQCVLNLLSNAVKFTPEEGTVSVTSSISKLGEANEDGDSEVLLKIVVQDSGIGIAAEDQTKLFQFFSQVDDSITRRFGGTGLGLAISHKICRLFGGDLTVDSEPGKGSSFTATFKVKVNMEKHPPEETNSKILQTKRCLVLEPSPLLGKNIQGHLNAFGMRSIVRANLESVQATGDQCDVAIIGHSYNQPETIRAIRAMGLHIHRLPLVVLMPFGATLPQQPDQKDLDSIDAVLSAPIRRMRLFRSLQSVFPVETGVPRFAKPTKDNLKTITNPGETFPRKDISILLVEDNLVNIKVATQLLKRSGYVPKVAHDGIEAVATCANEYFDLILMDLSMPRMGGLDATREIRATQLTEGKPFICAMTANAMASDKERCLEAGMNDYITKPVMLPQLIAVLDKVRDRISGTSENCQKLEADADHEEQKEHQIKDKKEGHRRDSLQADLGTDLNREDSSGTSLPTLSRVS